MALLKVGDHVVLANGVFGSTTVLFEKYLGRFGIRTTRVPLTDLQAWADAIEPETQMFFIETPASPRAGMAGTAALAGLAHRQAGRRGAENTGCTAALQRPRGLGADIVVVSATKYIDGQGRCVGGAVIGNEQYVGEAVYGYLRTTGTCLSPFNAWVFMKGLETLALRMRAHCQSAGQLALWLREQPGIRKVYYAGLPDHPHHELARHQQSGFGGLLAFDVEGGREGAWRFINATCLVSITANLGDAKTTITHPATTTHGRLTPDVRREAGISDGLVRVAVGLEAVEDLQADLQLGIDALKGL